MARHHLKTWPVPFLALWRGDKLFEVRKNDRNYAVGDQLVMQEWYPESAVWGERIVSADVSYVLDGEFGLKPGHVCMSLSNVRRVYYEGDENESSNAA